MIKKLFTSAAFIYFILSFLPGCIPSKPTEEVELLPSERLINRLEVNRRKIRNFEGSGSISIKSNQENYNATFRVTLQKPDSIGFTIMGPFGIEIAQALVTNENFIFYNALENTAYQGKADDQVLRDIFKVNLSFNDLMDAFIGSVNLSDNLYKPPAKYDIEYDEYVLTYVDSVSYVISKYRVDIRELGIRNYIVSDQYGDILEGRYSKFELLENVAVPYKIIVQNKRENQMVTIDYRNMQANKKNINVNFDIPKDAAIIKW